MPCERTSSPRLCAHEGALLQLPAAVLLGDAKQAHQSARLWCLVLAQECCPVPTKAASLRLH